ncbi:hypothetical protein H072_11484 [Dactylellina haptotyla CBS 200.50]|uniref:Uncharacterized protein n=1 Tax=Dactylellina haptotyla (strain CBS 200.50) TaxID=1284197 RepID=S8A234_DACHA|nr:hypothetical protein H072_11484 [Dactylellina haptotyla CBS 200.50]
MPSATLPSALPLELALLTSSTLPPYPLPSLTELLANLSAGDYEKILTSPLASSFLFPPSTSDASPSDLQESYPALISTAISESQAHPLELLVVGIAALKAYLQATTTGPPLLLKEATLLPPQISSSKQSVKALKEALIRNLSIDGSAAYHLLPYPVIFTLAKTILNSTLLVGKTESDSLLTASWWRLRVNFAHQRILRETSGSLQEQIIKDLDTLESLIFPPNDTNNAEHAPLQTEAVRAIFLLERSTIYSFYSDDKKVTKDLERAVGLTGLQYALTGRLGKRTKFQVDDITQLVVLARSKEEYVNDSKKATPPAETTATAATEDDREEAKPIPKEIDLNDDTLLDAISFTPVTDTIIAESDLPTTLTALDPSKQPTLHPIDSIILLHLAESIKNTNPSDGLTREQMSPYAERVLQHATNWSIYTLGLIVRSRLEAYKSRTVERSLLQLQVVVDQIIAATASADNEGGVSTFLPKPKDEESAGVGERLEYVFPLGLPTRWELESELAARWVDLGGLRTALEIYERLGMWAEVALCWAGVDKEGKAAGIVRKLLYEGEMPKTEFEEDNVRDDKDGDEEEEEIIITDEDEEEPVERNPPPAEAPRLWCILGDLEGNHEFYEKAWEVSGGRYARAQRSLGVYYLRRKEYKQAIEAFKLSFKVNSLNGGSWFQCGCAMMEVADWEGAVGAFSRVVGMDDTDAEAWSNLATALLRRGNVGKNAGAGIVLDDDVEGGSDEADAAAKELDERNAGKEQALRALNRAVNIKRDNWRMWENVLVIAASLRPPSWSDIQVALRRIIEIRGTKEGETCVDRELLDMLIHHVTSTFEKGQEGLPRITIDLVDNKIVPLITGDDRLWASVRKLAIWRGKYNTALEAQEKAFRVVSGRYDVRTDKAAWEELVAATEEIVDAYRSFGPMERTEGLGAGSGQMVMKDWKFKARSLVRNVMAKGRKAGWDEDDALWGKLEEISEGLKG